jgi:hypothetical protein
MERSVARTVLHKKGLPRSSLDEKLAIDTVVGQLVQRGLAEVVGEEECLILARELGENGSRALHIVPNDSQNEGRAMCAMLAKVCFAEVLPVQHLPHDVWRI